MDALELKIPPLLVGAAAALGIWIISEVVSIGMVSIPGMFWLAVALYCVGVATIAIGVFTFRNARTTIDPRTPVSTTVLVTHGIYSLSRNPMYVGFSLVLLGWAVQLGSLCSLLILPCFVAYMNRFQIEPEERAMRTKFGSIYEGYQARVRRWL